MCSTCGVTQRSLQIPLPHMQGGALPALPQRSASIVTDWYASFHQLFCLEKVSEQADVGPYGPGTIVWPWTHAKATAWTRLATRWTEY